MKHVLFATLVLGLATAALAAEVEVAPPPREAGIPLTPPADDPAAAGNPAETVDRIIKNSKSVGDRLAMTDAGTDTRKTQAQILKDIDDLLKQAENPPPQSNNNPDQNPNGGGGGGSKSNPNPKNGGGAGMKDGQPKGGQQPNGGQGGGRQKRPRSGPDKGNPDQQPGGDPKAGPDATPGGEKPDPKAGGPGGKDQQPGGAAGGQPNGKGGPALPIDDEVVKDVWGHLPETMRKQISEYYKEQFMPGYANLLRQYYSSLAEQNRRPMK